MRFSEYQSHINLLSILIVSFTFYEVTVTASTSVGPGNASVITFDTDVDGK